MTFEQLLAEWRKDQGARQVPEGWSQGRATFGGLTAAMLYEKMAAQVEPEASLRSLTISFISPMAAASVDVTATSLRTGRSVSQVEGNIRQGGSVAVAGLASFGKGRPSKVRVDSDVAPRFKDPENSEPLPYVPGVVPEFTRHFDYRIARGELPLQRQQRETTGRLGALQGGW